MEIGSGNVSAVVGPYRQAIATATLKFGIPYFVVDIGAAAAAAAGGGSSATEPYGGRTMPPSTAAGRPYNLDSVEPHPSELYSVVVDVLAAVRWTRLAVVYHDRTQGLMNQYRAAKRYALRPSPPFGCGHSAAADRMRVKRRRAHVAIANGRESENGTD